MILYFLGLLYYTIIDRKGISRGTRLLAPYTCNISVHKLSIVQKSSNNLIVSMIFRTGRLITIYRKEITTLLKL